jgi:hypothetical protein
MRRLKLLAGAAVVFAAGTWVGTGLARRAPDQAAVRQVLENARITVTEVAMAPGARRETYTRPTDQLIVFIDEADYEATDQAGTQKKHRGAGDVVWHNKGESAPLLVNKGSKPYRNLVIGFK